MTIHSISQLINKLDSLSPDVGYFDILKTVDIGAIEFERLAFWKPDRYTRNCIASSDAYELVMVCWGEGHQSPIHDYAAREAWVHIVIGNLEEQRYLKTGGELVLDNSSILSQGEHSYIDSSWIHRFSNVHGGRTISLHLYSHPIDFWTTYNSDTLKTKKVKVNYDSFMGEKIFV